MKLILLIVFMLSICHAILCSDTPPTSIIDSLKSQLEIAETDEHFLLLLKLAEKSVRLDPDQADSFLLKAKAYINESTIDNNLLNYYQFLAYVKLWQGHFEETIELSEKALQMQQDNIDQKYYPRVYENLGHAYYFLSEHVKAQEALFAGLRITDSLKLDTLKARLYRSIGMVYKETNDLKMAEKYYLQALDLGKKVKVKDFTGSMLSNLGLLYAKQKRYSEAEKLIFESIAMNRGEVSRSIAYTNLALIYHEQKKYKKALEYLQQALDIAEQHQQPYLITVGYMNLGEAYMELQNFELAKENVKTSLKMCLELNDNLNYIPGLLTASEIYERAGEHSESLNYYKEYSKLNDSLLNESRIKAVVELQAKYESEKKEKEILALSNDKTSAERRERNLVQAIILLCCGLLAIGSLFYFVRQNLHKNSIIQTKNLKIASDKIQLLEKSKDIIALESLIKGQENERERLAKEMHDGLGGLLAVSHSKLANLSVPEIKVNAALSEARDLVGDAYKQVRQISHNLMPLDLEKFGLVAALSNMIQTINQQNDLNIDFRTYHFDLFLNNELGLNIYRISQEAIANVLKSAKARHVLIELFQHEDMISLSIEDDGIGFNVHEKDSGIGIRSMRNRTELLNGKFSIESKLAVGTSIFVLFPHNSHEFMPSQT